MVSQTLLQTTLQSNELIILLTILVVWVLVQTYKKFTAKNEGKSFLVSGGMPSSHTATSVTLATLLFLYQGLTTTTILALFLVSVLIRDAVGVRQAVGKNAQVLYSITTKKEQKNIMLENGHTIKQVIVGAIIGVLCACISYVLFLM
jgi:uncharacterized protein